MPVKDTAGLNGKYDYMLQWIIPREDASTDVQADGPVLFKAASSSLALSSNRRRVQAKS
jgi:hypothetical protein